MSVLSSPFASVEHAAIWLLAGLSVVTWALALIKGWQFSRLNREDNEFLQRFWGAKNLEEGGRAAAEAPGSAARLAVATLNAVEDGRNGSELARSINREDRLERALRQQVQRERRELESSLAVLATIGSTSPFIGLFGTVWGIMEALKGISIAGSASLETVAGPIGTALVATGVGIAVAVPAVVVYNYFLRRVKVKTAELDDFAHDLYSLAQEDGFRVGERPQRAPASFYLRVAT